MADSFGTAAAVKAVAGSSLGKLSSRCVFIFIGCGNSKSAFGSSSPWKTRSRKRNASAKPASTMARLNVNIVGPSMWRGRCGETEKKIAARSGRKGNERNGLEGGCGVIFSIVWHKGEACSVIVMQRSYKGKELSPRMGSKCRFQMQRRFAGRCAFEEGGICSQMYRCM
jgi:hypothetical protein